MGNRGGGVGLFSIGGIVVRHNDQLMQPYYEQGFHLFTYEIASEEKPAVKLGRLIPFPFHRIPALKAKVGK